MRMSKCTCGGWRVAALAALAAGGAILAMVSTTSGGAADETGRTPTPAVVGETPTYAIDPVHTTVMFRIKHVGTTYFYGRFNDITGSINWDAANPFDGGVALKGVAITIDADSVDTANERRDGHLRSPDFFNVREFPEIRFTSTTFEKTGETTYAATGDLTMHGVTRPLTVELEYTGNTTRGGRAERIGFESVFTIKRSDFGMNYGIERETLGDEVRLHIGLQAIRQGGRPAAD